MWFLKKKSKKNIDNYKPNCWTLSWSGTIELGFPDGTYLPRKAALILHPQYFKDGEPILDILPMAYKLERRK
jgi:hypothetical protein